MRVASSSLTLSCAQCGRANRIPLERLTDGPRCGACSAGLPPIDEPLEVNADAFDRIVSSARTPVLVDFWAAWCGPCRAAAPQVAQTARSAAGRALVLRVDTEAEPELAARLRVQGIPNFAVLKAGQVVRQQAGLVDARTMLSWLV